MAWETSARPSELLQLKIGDIEDNIQLDEDGFPCAIFEVGRYGKTKESLREVGITKLSFQYYNRYHSNQVETLLEILSRINRDEELSSSSTKDFIMLKLDVLTDGEIGRHMIIDMLK
jgi:hypothetical protein